MKGKPVDVSFVYICNRGAHKNPDHVQEFVEDGKRVPRLDVRFVWVRRQDNIGASVFWCPEHGQLFSEVAIRGDRPKTVKEKMSQ